MRHRRKGRKLGRNPNHQRALLRSLACALILTERDPESFDESDPTLPKPPKTPGRIVTTLVKAKEVKPFVEKCVTIARKALRHQREADRLEPDAERNSKEWQEWRQSDRWREWNQAVAPALAARRRLVQLLGSKEAAKILFDDIAERFEDRPGGYTRVLRLAKPRLGDAGTQAILEFVGKNDRVKSKAAKPAFVDDSEIEEEETVVEETLEETESEGDDAEEKAE